MKYSLYLLILIITLPIFSLQPMRVVFLDVAQGDAIFIFSPSGKVFLLDAGDRRAQIPSREDEERASMNPAYDVILPFMKKENITHIDGIIISHAHADHIGGMASVIKNTPSVGTLYNSYSHSTVTFKKLIELANEKQIPVKPLYRGDKINIGENAYFDILNPTEEMVKSFNGESSTEERSLNDLSIVIKAINGDISYMLTGDAEIHSEEEMIYHNLDLKATFLKTGHHGSKTSSSPSFLEKVNPSYALISVGKVNRFSHPDYKFTVPNIKHFTEKNNGSYFQTDLMGTVDTWTDGKSFEFITEKNPFKMVRKPEISSSGYNFATISARSTLDSKIEIKLTSNTKIAKTFSEKKHSRDFNVTLYPLKPNTQYTADVTVKSIEGSFIFQSTLNFKTGDQSFIDNEVKAKLSKPAGYIEEKILGNVSTPAEAIGGELKIYSGSISKNNLVFSNSISNNKINFEISPTRQGKQRVFLVIEKNGKILSVKSAEIEGKDKIAGIDASHGNRDVLMGEMGHLKFILEKRGYIIKMINDKLDSNSLSGLDLLIIPSIPKEQWGGKGFTNSELKAVRNFIEKGNNLLLAGENDYSCSTDLMNKICESLDIDLRFNDDEVRSGEKGYRTLFLQNNLTETVPEKIKNIVVRNSCSIITKNNKPVQSSLTINKILQGNSQCFNADADNENDKIILKGSEIAIIASEQSPFGGRIILLGSTNLLLNDSFNHNEKHQTEDFVLWLPEFVTEKMTFTKNPKILLSQIFRLKNEDTRIQEKLSILLEKWEEVLTTEEFKDKTPQIAKEFHKRYINCNLEKQKILDNFRLTIIESLQNLSLNSNQENPELENLLLKLRLLD